MTSERPSPSPLELFAGFMTIGLTSVGGAAGPLRHVSVKQRKWLTEAGLAELFGIAQALPGATVANVGILLGDRACGLAGVAAAILGLTVPSLVVAILLASVATRLAETSTRFAAGELAVTAAVGGVFLSNGVRLIALLWQEGAKTDVRTTWRTARVAISTLGILLVAGLHVAVPLAVVVLVALSLVVEARLRAGRAAGA